MDYTQYNVIDNGRSTLKGLLVDKDRLIENIANDDKDMQRDFIIRRMTFKLNNLIDYAKKFVTLSGDYDNIDTNELYIGICSNVNKLKKYLSKEITDKDTICDFLELYTGKINSIINKHSSIRTALIFYHSFNQSSDITFDMNIDGNMNTSSSDCITTYNLDMFKEIKVKAIEDLFVKSCNEAQRDLNILLGTFEHDNSFLDDIKKSEERCKEKYNIKYSININAIYDINFPLTFRQRKMLNKVAVGNIDTVMSTNGAFDAAFIRYASDNRRDSYSDNKKEKVSIQYLRRMFKYVKNSGYIFLTIPDGFLDNTIIKEIAGNGIIENVYKTNISSDKEYQLRTIRCYFLVIRKIGNVLENSYSADAYREMYNYIHSDDFYNSIHDECEDIDFDLTLFNQIAPNEIKLFKGSYPDITSLMEVLQNSTAFDTTQHTFKVTPRPLLPFTKGQIGQILASGNLDGVIDEGNGYKHIIRGKVSKSSISNVSYEKVNKDNDTDMQYTITEVKKYSNTVDINALDASGRFTSIRLI